MAHEDHSSASADALSLLTPRERQVLGHAASGMTNAEVAAALAISTHAVKFHLAHVYRKLGAANRTEAAARYARATG